MCCEGEAALWERLGNVNVRYLQPTTMMDTNKWTSSLSAIVHTSCSEKYTERSFQYLILFPRTEEEMFVVC